MYLRYVTKGETVMGGNVKGTLYEAIISLTIRDAMFRRFGSPTLIGNAAKVYIKHSIDTL